MSEIKRKDDHYVLVVNGDEIMEGTYEECREEEKDYAGN